MVRGGGVGGLAFGIFEADSTLTSLARLDVGLRLLLLLRQLAPPRDVLSASVSLSPPFTLVGTRLVEGEKRNRKKC